MSKTAGDLSVEKVGGLESLSHHYGSELKWVAKRHVLRTDPEIKKTECKNCKALLVRKYKRKGVIEKTCGNCN